MTTHNSEKTQTNQNWSLIAMSPELGDLSIPISDTLSIGRNEANDIVLAFPQISRQHAKISQIGNHIYLQDLGSANGTFINGKRISTESIKLQPLDEIAFASLLFTIEQEDKDTDIQENLIQLADQPASITSVTTHETFAIVENQLDDKQTSNSSTQYSSIQINNETLSEPPLTTHLESPKLKIDENLQNNIITPTTQLPKNSEKNPSIAIIGVIILIILIIIVAMIMK